MRYLFALLLLCSCTPEEGAALRRFGDAMQGGSYQEPQQPDMHVYDSSECVGTIVMGKCNGKIMPNQAYHPTCHGAWIDGQCTGPMF